MGVVLGELRVLSARWLEMFVFAGVSVLIHVSHGIVLVDLRRRIIRL